MKQEFLTPHRIILLSVIAALPAVAQVSGSVQTILPTGATVQGNLYPAKTQVFFTAGPQNQKASGLPDGTYYFQLTDPSGSALLSNDPAACRQVVISGGRLAGAYPAGGCEHASVAPTANSSNGAAAVQVGGTVRACSIGTSGPDIFCNTTNPGGEYKLWLIAQSSAVGKCSTAVNPDGYTLNFSPSCAKTDNFKTALPAVSHVAACAFNDINGNGVLDPGELMISGWPITAAVPANSYVTLLSGNQSGTSVTATTDSTGCVSFSSLGIPVNTQVAVTLTEATLSRWTQTAPGGGTYDASGKPAVTGPTSVLGAVPTTGVPASGGIVSVNLGPGDSVSAPNFANTDRDCPDCSILGTVTVVNTATPQKLYTWGISKTIDKTESDIAAGASATFNYTVSVTHDGGAGSLLTGNITLINADGSNPSATLNVLDAVTDGGVCKIQDPVTGQYVAEVFNLTVNSFSETTLPYQCAYAGSAPAAGTNTVTATNLYNSSAQYTGAAAYNFSAATLIADQTAAITDTLKGALGTVSYTDASPKTFQYSLTFSSDPAGTCTNHNNTATLTTNTTSTTASASQSAKVCVSKASPSIATTPNPTGVTLGSSSVTLKDSATLSGGTNPSGTITFTLIYGGQTVDTEMVTVNGNGTYTTPGYTLPSTGTVVGTYQWNASYSGDTNNNAVSETGNSGEQVTVSAATPTIKFSSASPNVNLGDQVVDPQTPMTLTVNVSGYNPTGTLTFGMTTGSTIPAGCSTNVVLKGSGSYSATITCFNGQFVSAGAFWLVTYGGDSNNGAARFVSFPWLWAL